MNITVNCTIEERPNEHYYKFHASSQEFGDMGSVSGQGSTENEAVCDFENNVNHFYRSIFETFHGYDDEPVIAIHFIHE